MKIRFKDLNGITIELDESNDDIHIDTVVDLISNEVIEYQYICADQNNSLRDNVVHLLSKETYEALEKKLMAKENDNQQIPINAILR